MTTLREIVFDAEVLPQEWIITFKAIDNGQEWVFHNDPLGLLDYLYRNKSTCIFIGFNNRMFDNWVIRAIWYGLNPYIIVSRTILKDDKPWQIEELRFKRAIPEFYTFDLADELGGVISLKEIEGNLGLAIEESKIDFNYGGKLSEEDYQTLLDYNRYDIKASIELFNRKREMLDARKILCDIGEVSYTNINKTLPSLMSVILKSTPLEEQPEHFTYKAPSCIDLKDKTPQKNFERDYVWDRKDKFAFEHAIGGLPIDFALGGCHGALEKYMFESNEEETIIYCDVKQMYLNLMCNKTNPEFRFYPRTIENWQKLHELIALREKYRAEGKETHATAIKLGANTIYGSVLAETRIFTDWTNGRNICLTGQLCTAMLCECLVEITGVGLIQVNTDGVYIKAPRYQIDKIKSVCESWEKKLGLTLKVNVINGKLIQKDVNNYALYDKDTKEVTCKGKDVNKWNGGDHKSNSASIIDEAVVKYLIYDTPINHTIMNAYENNEVIKFQLIYNRKGKNYTATYHGDKECQKCNRVFPVNDKRMPTLTKLKNGSKHKFTDIPEHVVVNNKNCDSINLHDIDLDLKYYIEQANKRIERFK